MRLQNKVAIVTGAGSGIGRAISLAFAREGAQVVVTDHEMEKVDETVRSIGAAGGKASGQLLDVSEEDTVQRAIQETVEQFGKVDIMVNNAGIGQAPWDRIVAVNLSGVYYGTIHAAEVMVEHSGGSIINISSILGLVGFGSAPAYVASKHGIVGLTKDVAITYAKQGVRVNAICPGFIHTPMIAEIEADTATREAVESMTPMGRVGTPEEVAACAVFLASDEASYVTGTQLAVDGGWTAR